MREIKFLLYLNTQEGVKRYSVNRIDYKRYGDFEITRIYYGDYYVIGDALKDGFAHLVQKTGLKDRNGVEIYEGDIIEYFEPNYDESFSLIDYDTHRFVVTWKDYVGGFGLFLEEYLNPVVIGNIYEHSHLLEKN